ncbi:MAG: hypothetical protein V4574_10540 [Pseudomonadota bacterium]
MTSLLLPSYALTIAGQLWTQQAIAIDLRLAPAPQFDRLAVSFPAEVPIEAEPDDPVSLVLDGGEGEETVFTGTIASIRRGLDTVLVVAAGALGQLARYRPAETFENVSAGTVIRNLADGAGVATGDIADGVMLRYYAADPSRNAAEHAWRVAAWSGAMLASSPEGEIAATIVDATTAELALRYGRELTGFRIADSVKPDAVTVAGESGVSDAGSPDALRPIDDFFAGSRPDGPGSGSVWAWEPALRTAEATSSAGAAQQRMLSAAQRSGRLDAFLVPKLRPGVVIEVQDLPNGLASGPYWLEAVRHRIGPHGATTSARVMQGGDSFDPMALLGSLAGMF